MSPTPAQRRLWAGRLLYGWQAIILALGILGLVMWLPRLGQPFPGILYKYQRERDSYFVYFETGLQFPGIQAGLRINDRIVAVNGQAASQEAIDEAVRQTATAAPEEQVLVYDVQRGGQCLSVSVPLSKLTLNHLLEAKLPISLLGLSYLLMAWLVYRANPGEAVNQLFAVFATLAAGISLSIGYAGLAGRPPVSSPVPDLILWEPGVPFICAVLWHFFARFPERDQSSWLYRLRRVGYLPAGLLASFFSYQALFPGQLPSSGLSLAVSLATLTWLGAVLVVGFLHLARAYRRSPLQRVRRQISALLVGVSLGLMPLLIPLFAFWLSQNLSPLFGNNLYYLGLLFPLAVAYAILRYDLFRSKSVILALFILVGFSVLAANALYYLFSYLLDLPLTFLPLLLACLLTAVAWEVRSPLRRLFDRLFLRAAHDYRALSRFSEALLSVPQQTSGFADPCRVLTEQLGLAHASLWILDRECRTWRQAASQGADLPANLPLPESAEADLRGVLAQPVRVQEVNALLWTRLLPGVPAAVYVPLADRQACLGALVVGPRWNEEPLDDEDLSLLGLMGHHVSLVLLSMQQWAELRRVPHRIARAQELERYELSRDLHDTIQQFLGGLPFFLETAKRAVHQAPEQAAQLLDDCQELSQHAAQDLRAIRDRLSPGPLEGRDLTTALQTLIGLIPAADRPEILLSASAGVDARLSSEVKIALYRVAQQALDNALTHAQAQRIEVVLRRVDGRIQFAVADDGCGFDPDQAMQAGGSGHDGLWIMRDRVQMLGGELAIDSARGHGTVVHGWLPASDEISRP